MLLRAHGPRLHSWPNGQSTRSATSRNKITVRRRHRIRLKACTVHQSLDGKGVARVPPKRTHIQLAASHSHRHVKRQPPAIYGIADHGNHPSGWEYCEHGTGHGRQCASTAARGGRRCRRKRAPSSLQTLIRPHPDTMDSVLRNKVRHESCSTPPRTIPMVAARGCWALAMACYAAQAANHQRQTKPDQQQGEKLQQTQLQQHNIHGSAMESRLDRCM